METSHTYAGKVAYSSSNKPKWCNRIPKLTEEHPDEAHTLRRPEKSDGCIKKKFREEDTQERRSEQKAAIETGVSNPAIRESLSFIPGDYAEWEAAGDELQDTGGG